MALPPRNTRKASGSSPEAFLHLKLGVLPTTPLALGEEELDVPPQVAKAS
jgi:hypothetical protein